MIFCNGKMGEDLIFPINIPASYILQAHNTKTEAVYCQDGNGVLPLRHSEQISKSQRERGATIALLGNIYRSHCHQFLMPLPPSCRLPAHSQLTTALEQEQRAKAANKQTRTKRGQIRGRKLNKKTARKGPKDGLDNGEGSCSTEHMDNLQEGYSACKIQSRFFFSCRISKQTTTFLRQVTQFGFFIKSSVLTEVERGLSQEWQEIFLKYKTLYPCALGSC